uniref:Cytohesin 1 interacting protein n=1 Tax=Chelonoidis abingdonii TaxID=106734 RepID=A0A8C0G5X2_CHEAB
APRLWPGPRDPDPLRGISSTLPSSPLPLARGASHRPEAGAHVDYNTKMLAPCKYALMSAKYKKKVLPIFLVCKQVTIRVFLWFAALVLFPFVSVSFSFCFRDCGKNGEYLRCSFYLCLNLPGDILTNINGVNTEGFSHKQMQTLQEKWVEFRSLQLQEQCLLHGEVNDNNFDTLELESNLFGSCASPRPAFPIKPRFSSESSCKSRLSSMTVDSEDSFYQTSVFEDSAHETLSQQSSTDDDCFFSRDNDTEVGKYSLRRNRSISLASSGSMSPSWEGGSFSNIFGTLPRKNRRGSVRKQLLKFIPGLHRAVEEEESRV